MFAEIGQSVLCDGRRCSALASGSVARLSALREALLRTQMQCRPRPRQAACRPEYLFRGRQLC